jgi:hypothetical protein
MWQWQPVEEIMKAKANVKCERNNEMKKMAESASTVIEAG